MSDPTLTASGQPRKSTPGHGGARAGAGRPVGSRHKTTEPGETNAYQILAKAKAKRETYRAHLEELKYKAAARELIPIRDHETALATAFKMVAAALETLPDVLERDAGLSGAAIEVAQRVVDRVRDDLYRRLQGE